jgi:hypothetical protein
MEVNGQLHAPAALPPVKQLPSIHCIGGWVDPRAGLNAVAVAKIKKYIIAPTGIEPR